MILKRPLYHGRTIYQMLLYIPIHVWNQTGQNSEQFYFVFFVPEMTRHSNIVFICAFNSIISHVSSDADMNHWVNLRTIVFFLEQGQTACQPLLAQHFLHFFKKCDSLFWNQIPEKGTIWNSRCSKYIRF